VTPGAYGALVDLTEAINKLNVTYSQDDIKFFGVVDVELREVSFLRYKLH